MLLNRRNISKELMSAPGNSSYYQWITTDYKILSLDQRIQMFECIVMLSLIKKDKDVSFLCERFTL